MSELDKWAEAHTLELMALVAIFIFLFRVGHQAYAYYVTLP